MDKNAPIGIFDSGIGGLTVARAVNNLLPNESIVYFGDTAHLPYGDKSEAAIQSYSIKICNLLLEQQCKVILIACNSASTAAYDLTKEYTGSRAKVFDVINPVVDYLRENYSDKSVGLIGTKQTVSSSVYKSKIENLKVNICFKSLATPLLVPLIEEGFGNSDVTKTVLDEYLNNKELSELDALILGCTHYPLIKEKISSFYKGRTDVIDSSEITAKALKAYLEFNNLQNLKGQTEVDKFFVSDYTEAFEHTTKLFFGEEVHLEKYALWE